MALADLLQISNNKTRKKAALDELTEERVRAIIPSARQYIAFWREYPDLFIDFLQRGSEKKSLNFYFYQRVFLRACMRYKYVYMVFPREPKVRGNGNIVSETY